MPEKLSIGKCASCQREASKFSSGVPECWVCWEFRKLLGPESKFWIEGIGKLFSNDFGSGPDLNDLSRWKNLGILDEVSEALHVIDKLGDLYEALRKFEKQRREDETTANPIPGFTFLDVTGFYRGG